MSESKWKEGVVRPAMRGEVLGHFGIFLNDGVYSVTHLGTGFKGHESSSASEARSVAEAFNELPGWEGISLAPDGTMKVVGMTDELVKAACAVRERITAEPVNSEQASLVTG